MSPLDENPFDLDSDHLEKLVDRLAQESFYLEREFVLRLGRRSFADSELLTDLELGSLRQVDAVAHALERLGLVSRFLLVDEPHVSFEFRLTPLGFQLLTLLRERGIEIEVQVGERNRMVALYRFQYRTVRGYTDSTDQGGERLVPHSHFA